jgi:hypothetical protein
VEASTTNAFAIRAAASLNKECTSQMGCILCMKGGRKCFIVAFFTKKVTICLVDSEEMCTFAADKREET